MATCSSTRRRDPEVIVFHEPAWSLDKAKRRRKTKDGKRDDDDDTTGQVIKAKKAKLEERKKKIENEGVDFKQTMSEVQLLVSSSLEGKKKRKFEDQMIRSLGGKGRKPDKMPYPLYQEVLKRRREKEKREKDMLQAMGVSVKKRKKESRVRGNGWWQDKVKSLEPFAAGRFSGGALRLSEREVKQFKRR